MLAEVGRCLAPGGVQVFGVRSFEPADIATWLQLAGMDLLHLDGPAGALLFTARRHP